MRKQRLFYENCFTPHVGLIYVLNFKPDDLLSWQCCGHNNDDNNNYNHDIRSTNSNQTPHNGFVSRPATFKWSERASKSSEYKPAQRQEMWKFKCESYCRWSRR